MRVVMFKSGLVALVTFLLIACIPQKKNPLANAPIYPIQGSVLHSTVEQYCIACHNPEKRKGNLDLKSKLHGNLNDYPFVWKNVAFALAQKKMPPADDGVDIPDDKTYQAVNLWLNERFNHQSVAEIVEDEGANNQQNAG